jgi:hypothetical protein
MNHNVITAAILDQFERSLTMFKIAVSNFTADEWVKGEKDYFRPAGTAYHIVESIHFYTGDIPVDRFEWGSRFNCDWEDPDPNKLPTQAQIITYLNETWDTSRKWLLSLNPTQPEDLFPWIGKTVTDRLLYLLRHTQHHIAEMSLELKKRGFKVPEWQ